MSKSLGNFYTLRDLEKQDELNNVISSTNTSGLTSTVTSKLNSQISYINCGMGCLASSKITFA